MHKSYASFSTHDCHHMGHPKVTKYQRDNFPHKRPPQNVWPSKNILSPRNLKIILSVRTGHPKVTKYQRDDFPHKRPPQNVWPFKIFLSPRNLEIILSVRSGNPRKLPSTRGVISLTKDRHKMCGHSKFF